MATPDTALSWAKSALERKEIPRFQESALAIYLIILPEPYSANRSIIASNIEWYFHHNDLVNYACNMGGPPEERFTCYLVGVPKGGELPECVWVDNGYVKVEKMRDGVTDKQKEEALTEGMEGLMKEAEQEGEGPVPGSEGGGEH